MDVAFFTDSYLPTRDGTAVVVDALARALQRRGHSVRIHALQPHPAPTREPEGPEGVGVARVRSHPVPLYGQYRSPYVVSLVRHFRRDQSVRRADIVHLHTPGLMGTAGFFLARRFGVPLVATFHTHLSAMRSSVAGRIGVGSFFRIAWLYNLGLYWRCDLTTAPTLGARVALERAARKPFRRRIEVVPNGIDPGRMSPGVRVPDWRSRCGFGSGPLVSYVGRLTTDKGIHRFLDAIAEAGAHRDLAAVVAGVGPEEAAVRRRLAGEPELARRVRYVGPVAEEEKAALLGQSELFVLPSTSDTSSVSMLEAMACGTPCVGPDVGGPAEVIEEGINGRKASMTTPGALTRAIVSMLEDEGARRRMGANGIEYVRRAASIDAMARRFEVLYEELGRMRAARSAGKGTGLSGVSAWGPRAPGL